jgi:glucose-1-phosphate thymidylyltransferase
MRGVILAGGSGSRLAPQTEVQSKAMAMVYDRPAIEYPLNTLKAMGCDSAVIIASPQAIGDIASYFKEGDRVGLDLIYRVQAEPKGVADAISKARDLVKGIFPLLLGDCYYDPPLKSQTEPTLFWHEFEHGTSHSVWHPESDTIIEKPRYIDIGRKAIIGYYYDERVFDFIDGMTPAQSGELEIVDIHNYYRQLGTQFIEHQGYFADMGTPDGVLRAAEHEQGKKNV